MNRFFGLFDSVESIHEQWSGSDLSGAQVIAAVYTDEDYSGDATVIFRKEGKLFEVHCSHCSCNGLEYWEPQETSYEALMDRYTRVEQYQTDTYGDDFVAAVKKGLVDEIFEREVLLN